MSKFIFLNVFILVSLCSFSESERCQSMQQCVKNCIKGGRGKRYIIIYILHIIRNLYFLLLIRGTRLERRERLAGIRRDNGQQFRFH